MLQHIFLNKHFICSRVSISFIYIIIIIIIIIIYTFYLHVNLYSLLVFFQLVVKRI